MVNQYSVNAMFQRETLIIFNITLLGFTLPVDIFEKVFKPNNFITSKEKISVYGRETYARMFHGQLVV